MNVKDTRREDTPARAAMRERAKRYYHSSEERRLRKIAQVELWNRENPERALEVRFETAKRRLEGTQRAYRKSEEGGQ